MRRRSQLWADGCSDSWRSRLAKRPRPTPRASRVHEALERRRIGRARPLADPARRGRGGGRGRQARGSRKDGGNPRRRRPISSSTDWATPAALRCRGLLLLAQGESEAALVAAEQAASGLQRCRFPSRPRPRIAGRRRGAPSTGRAPPSRCRARGRQGRVRRARRALVDRAGGNGAQTGAALGRAAIATLTSAERRVASLVAAGRTNREVSAQLFTTVATVEAHLTRIYRKLGLRSRTELARRVADGTLDLAVE